MKKLLLILACLMLMACAGPQSLVFDGSVQNPDGSVKDNAPDYMTYAGEGYGFAAIHPIGGIGGGK